MYENADDGQQVNDGENDANNNDRIECPTCGRKFVQEAL
jgi:DNA-directed RNA polymerase subunit RPC12/RpoP